MSVSFKEREKSKLPIKATDNDKSFFPFMCSTIKGSNEFFNSFYNVVVLQQHMIMPLRNGTCGLTLILTRWVVRTREIPLIIMIRVEILSAEKSYFTRAFSRGRGRSVHFMEREISRCILLPPVSNLFALNLVSQSPRDASHYFLNPRSYFRIGDHCEIGTRELYGPINYT